MTPQTPLYIPNSTFRIVDMPISALYAQEVYSRSSQRFQVIGGIFFSLSLFAVPLTIVIDLVIGVAQVCFSLYQKELTTQRFLKIAEKNFVLYPLEQMIYFVVGLAAFCRSVNYTKAYAITQTAVVSFTYLTHNCPPQIFNRRYVSVRPMRSLFPGVELNEGEESNVKTFMIYASWFKYHFKEIKRDPPTSETELVRRNIVQVLRAESADQVFGLEGIRSYQPVREKHRQMRETFKQASNYQQLRPEIGSIHSPYPSWAQEELIKVVDYANLALSAYFDLPLRVRELAKKEF